MKKIFIMISVLTVMLLCSIQVSAISGEGTEESPYLITNEAELFLVKDFPGSHFVLMNDVYVSDTSKNLGTFTGVFNGSNHTINLSFYSNHGVIKNVYFKNTEILLNDNYGKLEKCTVSISGRTYEYNEIKPLVCSKNYGTISKCRGEMSDNVFNVMNSSVSFHYYDVDVACFVYKNEKSAIIEKSSFTGENLSIGSWLGDKFVFSAFVYDNSGRIVNSYVKCEGDFPSDRNRYTGELFGTFFYGMTYVNEGHIENAYVIASVSTEMYESGFENDYYYDEDNSYVESKGTSVNTYSCINDDSEVDGSSKSNLAMKMKATYVEWDFETVWSMDASINDGYPYLRMGDDIEQVSSPYANVEFGTIKSGTKVIISSATDGATIYYTLDGSTPSSESIRYTEPLIIDKDTTVKVIAVKDGMRDSDIKEFKYTIIPGSVVEPEKPVVLDYTINSIKIKNANDEELELIPEKGKGYIEINITNNTERTENDYLIIAMYDDKGAFIDFTYEKIYNQNQEMTTGTSVSCTGVKKIKAFVWDGISSMAPLSNFCTFE